MRRRLATALLIPLVAWPTMRFGSPASRAANDRQQERDAIHQVVDLLELVVQADPDTARRCLGMVEQRLLEGALPNSEASGRDLRRRLEPVLAPMLEDPDHPLHLESCFVAAHWRVPEAVTVLETVWADADRQPATRGRAAATLLSLQRPGDLDAALRMLADGDTPSGLRESIVGSLARRNETRLGERLVTAWPDISPEVKPQVVELLTQRPAWANALLRAVVREEIPAHVVDANQLRKLQALGDPGIADLIREQWGQVRTERDPGREAVVARMREMLLRAEGDPQQGREVYARVCGQCHRLHGDGHQVGPDLTDNGRSSFDQLVSNVFDPNLVIGESYQARTVVTLDGRVLNGLLIEDNERRVVLNTQGGKVEAIPRDDIDFVQVSRVSLMPEGLENQLTDQEIADLFSYLLGP